MFSSVLRNVILDCPKEDFSRSSDLFFVHSVKPKGVLEFCIYCIYLVLVKNRQFGLPNVPYQKV